MNGVVVNGLRMNGLRIDKWLWAARFFKTRSLAQAAVEAGKVRLEGERVKPSKELRAGDRVQVASADNVWEMTVEALSDKRGPAPQARKLYAESEASQLSRATRSESRRLGLEPALGLHGRPTKRERRSLAKLRGY